jgi:hypothetical protein
MIAYNLFGSFSSKLGEYMVSVVKNAEVNPVAVKVSHVIKDVSNL